MATKRHCGLIGILDADNPNKLVGLQQAGSSAGADLDLSFVAGGAVQTVAGVAPDGGKDIPVASLGAALIAGGGVGNVKKVAGLDPNGSGAITAANLNVALATILSIGALTPDSAGNVTLANFREAILAPFTVAGVAASGGVGTQHWGGDIASASLVTAIQDAILQAQVAARTMTWAAHLTAGNGTYNGQRRRISVTAGGPNQEFELEWSSALSVWNPVGGRQLVHVGAIVTDTNSSGTQNLTGTAWTAPANFFRPPGAAGVGAIGMEVESEAETSISATARTVIGQLDATASWVNPLAAAANRRTGGRWGFIPTDATHGFAITKVDGSEFDFTQSANTNLPACDRTWSNAIAVSLAYQFTTAASAATATLRRYKVWMVHG